MLRRKIEKRKRRKKINLRVCYSVEAVGFSQKEKFAVVETTTLVVNLSGSSGDQIYVGRGGQVEDMSG